MTRHKPAKRTPKRTRYDADAKLRSWIFELIASPEIEGKATAQNGQVIFDWIKHGTVPGGAEIIKVERKSA